MLNGEVREECTRWETGDIAYSKKKEQVLLCFTPHDTANCEINEITTSGPAKNVRMLKRAWLSLEERATKNVKNPQTGCATDFVIHIFCVALICGMCTLRPDVMPFYACTGICASRRPFSSYNIQHLKQNSHTTHHPPVSFHLTVIWKLQHALWLFGWPCLMQNVCNLKCVVILIKFRWKWESLMMTRTKLLSYTMVNLCQ